MATKKQRDDIDGFKEQVRKWIIPDDDELKSMLQEIILSRLDDWKKYFEQCEKMTKLDSPSELDSKIEELDDKCQFYIGYTEDLSTYLWNTGPKSGKWERVQNKPIKIHTYYVHLNGQATEDEFIVKWGPDKRCLNATKHGLKHSNGILYLVVYDFENPLKRVAARLRERAVTDRAFRKKMKK